MARFRYGPPFLSHDEKTRGASVLLILRHAYIISSLPTSLPIASCRRQDLVDLRLLPKNFGDNRGPSATIDPEHSRVSLFVDYENGVVAVRQNPTTTVDGARGGADTAPPQIHVVEAPDGRMTIDYNAWDAYEFSGAVALDMTVHGRITLDPLDNGTVNLGGNTTIYPAWRRTSIAKGYHRRCCNGLPRTRAVTSVRQPA